MGIFILSRNHFGRLKNSESPKVTKDTDRDCLPTMLVMVLNLSRSQSMVSTSAMCLVPRLTALRTITRVTRPALGIPAAPIAATVAVRAVITISGFVSCRSFSWAINRQATASYKAVPGGG